MLFESVREEKGASKIDTPSSSNPFPPHPAATKTQMKIRTAYSVFQQTKSIFALNFEKDSHHIRDRAGVAQRSSILRRGQRFVQLKEVICYDLKLR